MKLQETKSVYLILNVETQKLKIGVSGNIKRRLDTLIYACGCKLELIYASPLIEKPMNLEGKLHELFKEYRSYGEWFTIGYSEPLKELKRLEKDYKRCIVYDMFERGLNPTKIAKELGVSRTAIVKNLRSKGISIKSTVRDDFDKLEAINQIRPIIEVKQVEIKKESPIKEVVKKEVEKEIVKVEEVTKLDILSMVIRNQSKEKVKKNRFGYVIG